jgi:RNA polymerase primary sigma factor
MQREKESSYYKESVSVKSYYKDIKKIEVLSGDDQIQLAIKAKAGDQKAFEELTKTNLRFVISVAKDYLYSGLPLEDLISEGNIGLMEAVSRFDENKGFKFISYAVWWIRHALIKAVNEHSGNIRLPVNRINSINKIVKTKEKLFKRLGRDPSDAEILAELDDITESDMKSFNINGNFEISLDNTVRNDSDTEVNEFLVGDSYKRFEQGMNHQALKDELGELFGGLTDREIIILNMYFGLNGEESTTLRDIAERLSLTNERVRQIKEDTLRRLRVFEKSSALREFLNTSLGNGE